MPISTILITDSIDTGRLGVNQISTAINGIITSGLSVTGNVIINPANTVAISLNVASGQISGNGFNIFSVPASSLTLGTFLNSQIQNANIVVTASTGMSGGGTLFLGSSIALDIVPIDSITSTTTDVAASANSFVWANSVLAATAINANIVNAGVLLTTFGGTGRTSYSLDNQIFIGTAEGSLTGNTIRPGVGLTATYTSGGMVLSANIIQGANTLITEGNKITLNAAPSATLNDLGIVRLSDVTTDTSLTLAPTANVIKTLAVEATAKFSAPSNAMGRLIEWRIYSTPGTYTWTKPANTWYIDITVIGGGGGGAGCNNGTAATGAATYGSGGYAGALLYASIANNNVNTTMTITVGYAGNSSGNIGMGRVGYRGQESSFANNINSAVSYYAYGGNGGMTSEGVGSSTLKPYGGFLNAINVSLATARGPITEDFQPEYILTVEGDGPTNFYRFGRGNVIGSWGGSVPGWCQGGWSTYAISVAGNSGNCITYGPGGNTVAQSPNGDSFGGGGGAGAYNETSGVSSSISGASGANGYVSIKVYSNK